MNKMYTELLLSIKARQIMLSVILISPTIASLYGWSNLLASSSVQIIRTLSRRDIFSMCSVILMYSPCHINIFPTCYLPSAPSIVFPDACRITCVHFPKNCIGNMFKLPGVPLVTCSRSRVCSNLAGSIGPACRGNGLFYKFSYVSTSYKELNLVP